MEKTVSSQDAPERFSDLLQDVSGQGDHYVVGQDGVPLAAVVPFALYANWKRRRERFFQHMRESGDRVGLTDEEAMQRTDEARQAIRIHQP